MDIFGLTGGIASGKTEAARRFEAHGIPVIDADRIGHEVIAPGGPAEQAVIEAFGPGIVENGAIDRVKLGAAVFGNPDALAALNRLTHPAIIGAIGMRCAELMAAGRARVLIDAALLADNGQVEPWMKGLILVLSPRVLRMQRLIERRGLTPEEAARRIDAQVPPESKRPLATWTIENNGTLEALRAQVDNIVEAMHGSAR